MSNKLNQPVEISPSVRDTDGDGTPDSDVVGATWGVPGTDWVSQWFPVEGSPSDSEELSLMCYVDWSGAAEIQILPQFRHKAAAIPHDSIGREREPAALPITEFDGGRLDASYNVEPDAIALLAANFRSDPGAQEIALAVTGVSEVRFLARAPAGAPTLRMQALTGGGV